jgi:hypothetical protein
MHVLRGAIGAFSGTSIALVVCAVVGSCGGQVRVVDGDAGNLDAEAVSPGRALDGAYAEGEALDAKGDGWSCTPFNWGSSRPLGDCDPPCGPTEFCVWNYPGGPDTGLPPRPPSKGCVSLPPSCAKDPSCSCIAQSYECQCELALNCGCGASEFIVACYGC